MSIRKSTTSKFMRRLAVGGLAVASAVTIFGGPAAADDTRGDALITRDGAKCQHLFGSTYICKVTVFGDSSEYVCVLNRGCVKQ
jgi:hypothetical protein